MIAHPVYAALAFRPAFVEQIDGVGFVYLRPQAWRGEHMPEPRP